MVFQKNGWKLGEGTDQASQEEILYYDCLTLGPLLKEILIA